MNIFLILFIIIAIILIYILLKCYFEKYDNAIGYTGGLGSGKTLKGVSLSIKLLRRNRLKVSWLNFKTWVYNLFHKYKKKFINEKPMLYSSIPIFIKSKNRYFKNCNVIELKQSFYIPNSFGRYLSYDKFVELGLEKRFVKKFIEASIELLPEHLLLQYHINEKSIVFIDEIGGFCSQYEYANLNAQGGFDEFIRLFRHYTKGGYFIFTDQCSDNIVKIVRVRLNKIFNLNNFKKYFIFYRVGIREISTSEDIKTIEQNMKEDNEKVSWGIMPPKNRYDTYCYSERYNNVPKGEEDVYCCLKRFSILKIPKVYKKPLTINKGVDNNGCC